MHIKLVVVVGAGIMGRDVALDLACYEYHVILNDISENIIRQATEKIRENFKLVKMMKRDVKSLSIDDILSKIIFTTSYDGFERADLVIENITENWDTKKKMYLKLRELCKEETIYAVNTSCISITKIGALMPKPGKVIGMHFLNPVPMKKLVEVIRGHHTTDETVETSKNFLKSINKTPVVVNDFPGFVTNRVLMLTINECIWTVQDNVAKPTDIDKIFRLGFGHKMGPLAIADLIGLDTILNSLIVLYESYNDSKYRPCPLLRKMVDAGLLGRKNGRGFFEYNLKGG